MTERLNNIKVYHGSYTEVKIPDLNKCRSGKDFGRGFYITTDKQQAIKFSKLIADRYNTPFGVLNEYLLSNITDLKYYAFESTDLNWLNCIVGNRRRRYKLLAEKWKEYDVLSGKIANDDTSTVINAYLLGIYGEIGSEKAGNTAISNLEPENLKNQLCFRTEKALKRLCFIKSEKISLGR